MNVGIQPQLPALVRLRNLPSGPIFVCTSDGIQPIAIQWSVSDTYPLCLKYNAPNGGKRKRNENGRPCDGSSSAITPPAFPCPLPQ